MKAQCKIEIRKKNKSPRHPEMLRAGGYWSARMLRLVGPKSLELLTFAV